MKKVRFTKSFLDSLQTPSKGRVSYRDDLEGLSAYITSSGSITFFARKRINGRDTRMVIGNYPELTIEQARKKAQELKGLVALGKNPHAEKIQERKNNKTFGELFEEYLERHSKVVKKSWIYDQREFKLHLSHWYKKKLGEIKKDDIQKLHERLNRDSGTYQANRILERVRAIYNKAIEWGWEGNNPTQGIRKYKEKSRDRFIQPHELPHLYKSIMVDENENFRDLFLFLLLTGVRKMNAQMMRWEQVIWERSEWRIPDTKNGDPLTIPLSIKAEEILQARLKKSESRWVFPQDEDATKHIVNLKRGWKRILERASLHLISEDKLVGEWVLMNRKKLCFLKDEEIYREIKRRALKANKDLPQDLCDIRIHDIRRTFGSYQALTGASLQIIGASLGHKSIQSTQIYARLNLTPVRVSVERAVDQMYNLISA